MRRRTLPSAAYVRTRLLLDPLTGFLFWKSKKGTDRCTKSWNARFSGKVAGCADGSYGYWLIGLDFITYQAHRLVWLHYYGFDPGEMEIDHIDQNKSNNALSNLRLATSSENHCNKPQPKRSMRPYKGVEPTASGRFQASIRMNNKRYCLGMFDTAEAARQSYIVAAEKLHKDFCKP